MKKIYIQFTLLLLIISFSLTTRAQLTGTLNIPGSYATLALAITDLNAQGVGAGGVTLNLIAGNPQTTPAGGFVIGNTGNILVGATNPTAANPVIIEGNGNTITAFTTQTVGSINDGIFKLIGADYITIQNFIMQENAANIINTPAGSNNMTEFGVALFRVSVTDGAQNNTIQGNVITLNRTYTNTFGIYSNVRNSATAVATTADITNVTGSNFGNRVYNNAINNVNYGVVFNGSAIPAQMDSGNDVGGSSAATGNTFTNWGTGAALSGYVNLTGSNYCVFVNHQINDNISYNTITSSTHTAINTLGGILKNYSVAGAQPIGTITTTINNNTVTVSKSAVSGAVIPINSQGISPALSTATISINNNTILNCAITGAGSSNFIGISNASIVGTLNINSNAIRGTSTNVTTGSFTGINSTGAVVNTINITNNQIGNTAGGAVTFSAVTTGTITGITNTAAAATTTVNFNNNSVEGISAVSSGQLAGIINTGNAGVAVNINNNNLGSATANFVSYNAATANVVFGLYNGGGVAATTAISISNNNIRGIVHSVTASSTHQYISSYFAGATQNINNNTFTNLNVNTTGDVFFIAKQGNMTATGVENCSNNSIVTAFNKTGAGGAVYFYFSGASAVNGSTMTQTGNNFSNVTVTGPAAIGGWFNADGALATDAPTKTITGNTFTNINGGSGLTYVMAVDYAGLNSLVSSNTISTVTGAGDVVGIIYDVNCNQGTHNINLNSISNLSSTGVGGGEVYGILAGAVNIPTLNVDSNTVTGLSTAGPSSGLLGIGITDGATVNVNTNTINTLTGSGTLDPLAVGIAILGGTTINVGYNKIHSINQTGVIATPSGPVVLGISFESGVNVTSHNNFVANLNAANTAFDDAIRGISINSTIPLSTYDLYYNSVFVNTPSNLATSGTSGIYHTTNATATTAALNMVNNIIVNTSASAGVGRTAAYRRSSIDLTNFAATSNYNLLYAGTPSATKLIFFDGTNSDQTLADYQTRVAIREANSISSFPTFVSATDLHLDSAVNCALNGRGVDIPTFTLDIDNNTRDNPNPDMGADEFTSASPSTLAGVVSTTVCENKTINPSGTLFINAGCQRIARVVPSGGSAVSGVVNTCVYLDPTVLPLYNAEPYLQRHFDITPAAAPLTSTGTITLYFTQAEFDVYNGANGVWPDLPNAPGDATGIANLRITQYHGSPLTSPSLPNQYSQGTATYINPADANIVWNGSFWAVTFNVAGFSGFYIHTNLQYALPITFNYLKGTKQGSNHLLNWKVTCNSSPRVTLVLERSISTSSGFTAINTVDASAARCATPFNYTDASPLQGMNYYRLKMIDADGKVTYSNVIAILNATKGFEVINIAPNPVTSNGTFKLNITSAKAEKLQTIITDMQGRIVATETITTAAGYNSIDMNVAKLAAGTYSLYTTNNGEKSKVIRFVKQ